MESHENSSKLISSERYIEYKYEDFLERPEETVRSILNSCGLEWNESFNNQFKKRRIDSSRKEAYKTDLDLEQCVELEASISDKLAEYGYNLNHITD